jgi:hypothetical protein
MMGDFANSLLGELADEMTCAIAVYNGSLKKFVQQIAEGLDFPTENENGRPMTADALKDELTDNLGDRHLLILPESQRLPASVRYWLEALLDNGVRIAAFSIANPRRDFFLKLHEIELSLPSDREIRQIMEAEARKRGLRLNRSQLAELQSRAGKNPFLARKVVSSYALGLEDDRPEHSQYLDISPIIIASLFCLGIVRFVGLGTGNRGLYIVGGVAFILAMMFRQLGQIKGAKKRLGQ